MKVIAATAAATLRRRRMVGPVGRVLLRTGAMRGPMEERGELLVGKDRFHIRTGEF